MKITLKELRETIRQVIKEAADLNDVKTRGVALSDEEAHSNYKEAYESYLVLNDRNEGEQEFYELDGRLVCVDHTDGVVSYWDENYNSWDEYTGELGPKESPVDEEEEAAAYAEYEKDLPRRYYSNKY